MEQAQIDAIAHWELMLTYGLFGAALVLAFVIGPVMNAISDPKSLLKGIVSIVFIGVIFAIAYSLANGDMVLPKYNVHTEATSRFIGALLYTTYLMFGIALLGIVATLIKSTLRKLGIG